MASTGSWPNPDVLSQCFTVVRWFHEQGTTWRGTASELASQLSSYSDTTNWISSGDQLISFLETNVIMLRELGVEAAITRFTGRPSVVDLKSSAADAQSQPKISTDGANPAPVLQRLTLGPQTPDPAPQYLAPQNEAQQLIASDEITTSDAANLNQPADRLYSLLGVPEIEIMLDGLNPEAKAEAAPASPPVRVRAKSLPLLVGAALSVVLLVAVFVFVRGQSAKSNIIPPPANSAAVPVVPVAAPPVEVTPAIDPVESDEFNKLMQQASSTKDSTAQYELALRYAEGRGVKQDHAAAYLWLVLARTNGSLAADSSIQTLVATLSPSELEKARIAIGTSFTNGVGVQRNYVHAHHWFALAELSGSSEAGALKRQLETRMPLWQIQQATAQNATH
jgi:hypothetical protein